MHVPAVVLALPGSPGFDENEEHPLSAVWSLTPSSFPLRESLVAGAAMRGAGVQVTFALDHPCALTHVGFELAGPQGSLQHFRFVARRAQGGETVKLINRGALADEGKVVQWFLVHADRSKAPVSGCRVEFEGDGNISLNAIHFAGHIL